jgi:hypothetical protein
MALYAGVSAIGWAVWPGQTTRRLFAIRPYCILDISDKREPARADPDIYGPLQFPEERQKLGSLDPDSALAIWSLTHSLARTKRTAILCTLHQPQFAEKFADARDTAIPLDFASPRHSPYD